MIGGAAVRDVAAWLASLGITGAIAAGGAWALFRWLGGKWVEDHFSKELEAFKADKQTELAKLRVEYERETERLKADLSRFADRASRFHVREYEVLPEAWGLMNKALGAASSAVSAFQQLPDLDRMGQPQFESWLEQVDLAQYQKDELQAAMDKTQRYMRMRSWKQITDANQAIIDFMNYVILQGIFIDEVLSQKMMEAGANMRKAMISRSMAEELQGIPYKDGQPKFREEASDGLNAVEAVVMEIKQEVRQRLSSIRLAQE